MLIKAVKTLDWCLNKYASGIQPTILTKIINLTGELSSSTGSMLNIKVLEKLGKELESFNFKEEVISKSETDTLGVTGASVVRM